MTAHDSLEAAHLFARVAEDLASQPDADALAQRLAKTAGTLLGCPWVQVVQLNERGAPHVPPACDSTLQALAQISAESDDCLTSATLRERTTLVIGDVDRECRWPEFIARIRAETPIRSAASYFMKVGTTPIGVLGVFSPNPGHFDDDTLEIGSVLAEHAAVAAAHITTSGRAENLAIALLTNRKIGMAIGVLMSRRNLTDEQAFDLLRVTSQHTHNKLRDIAEYVTMTGDLPDHNAIGNLPRAALPHPEHAIA